VTLNVSPSNLNRTRKGGRYEISNHRACCLDDGCQWCVRRRWESDQAAAVRADLATVANMFEMQASELAVKQAKDAITREFAKHMIADHSKAGEEIKSAAEADKVVLPTQLDDEHQAELDALAVAKGSDFDKAYLAQQLEAYETAVALFSVYCTSGEEGDMKKFAAKTLPALTQQLA
jgi:putative membrane protein